MDVSSFSEALAWLIRYGYPLMFVLMLIEGPVVTAAAAFAAGLGYFNIWIVFVLSFFGDLLTDIFYYAIGYWGREKMLARYGGRVGLTKERMERIEEYLRRHAVRGLAIIKLLPVIPTAGLITAGAIRMPLKQFLRVTSLVILGTTILQTVIGFYFGEAYEGFARYTKSLGVSIGLFVVLAAAFYIGFRYAARRIRARLAHQSGLPAEPS